MEKFQRELGGGIQMWATVSPGRYRAVDQHDLLRPATALERHPVRDPQSQLLVLLLFRQRPAGRDCPFIDPSYSISHVTFYCKNHQGDNVEAILNEARNFVKNNPMEKADFRLAGRVDRRHRAANEEILKNDILMQFLGFGTIFLIVMIHLSGQPIASFVMMIGLFPWPTSWSTLHGLPHVGINLQSLPIVTVGVGFGIDYALYIVSRAVEEYKGDVTEQSA